MQRKGTAAVGRVFGPVMIIWFLVIGERGRRHCRATGDPQGAVTDIRDRLLGRPLRHRVFALAAIVLAVTGAEALYADMGHFGRRSISGDGVPGVSACVLSYLGQGGLILENPANISSPFFLLVTEWGRLPMVCWPPRRRSSPLKP